MTVPKLGRGYNKPPFTSVVQLSEQLQRFFALEDQMAQKKMLDRKVPDIKLEGAERVRLPRAPRARTHVTPARVSTHAARSMRIYPRLQVLKDLDNKLGNMQYVVKFSCCGAEPFIQNAKIDLRAIDHELKPITDQVYRMIIPT